MELSRVLLALRNADAAGDEAAARRLAQIAREIMAQEGAEEPPAAPPKSKEDTSGLIAAASAGVERLKGEAALTAGKLGLMDTAEAARYQQEREAEAAQRFTPTEDGWTESPFLKFKETLGGSLPYMAAPVLAAGAVAASPLTGPAALLAGGAAAFAANYPQFIGTNLARQIEEGKSLEQTDLGSAALAALPQAGLDTAASLMLPGVSKILGKAGIDVSKETARQIAKQATLQTLMDYTVKTGKAMGREGLTETAQQALERLQAGLDITDEKARAEYFETFIAGAALAGAGAPIGRAIERGAAKAEVAREDAQIAKQKRLARIEEEEQAKQEAEQAKIEQARLERDPAYLLESAEKYESLLAQSRALREELKTLPKKSDDPAVGIRRKEITDNLTALKKQLTELVPLYNKAKTARSLQEQQKTAQEVIRQQEIELQAQRDIPQQTAADPYFYSPQATFPGIQPIETTTPMPELDTQARAAALYEQQQALSARLVDIQEQQRAATSSRDFEAFDRLDKEAELYNNELTVVTTQLNELGGFQDATVQRAELVKKLTKTTETLAKKENQLKAMGDSGSMFDPEKARKTIADIKRLEAERDTISGELQQFGTAQMSFTDEQMAPRELENDPRRARAAEAATRPLPRGLSEIESQEQEALAGAEAARVTATEEADRDRRLAPEVMALRRIASNPAHTSSIGEGQVSGFVDDLVESLAVSEGGPAPAGRFIEGAGTQTERGDVLRGQLAYAEITNNQAQQKEIKAKLAAIGEPETSDTGGVMPVGVAAKTAGVEGRLSPAAIAANRVTRLSRAQVAAYDRLADFVERVRESSSKLPPRRIELLKLMAQKLQENVVGIALTEMDARRAQAGKPALSTNEKVAAIGRINKTLNELVERGASVFFTPVTTEQASTRGTLTLRSAKETVKPKGQRVFNNYQAAAKSLRGQMRAAIDKVAGIQAPVFKEPPPPKRGVDKDSLRVQFPTERTAQARLTAAISRAKSDKDVAALEEIQQMFPRLSDDGKDLALEQADRVESGLALEIPAQLQQELAMRRQAAQSDTLAQTEMFVGDDERGAFRTTATRFLKFLDSHTASSLRAKVAEETKAAAFRAKRAETIAANAEKKAKEAEAFQNKMLAGKAKNPVEAAKRALENTVNKSQEALALAREATKKKNFERTALRGMVQDLESLHAKNTKQLTEIQEALNTVSRLQLKDPNNKKLIFAFNLYTNQLGPAQAAFNRTEKALNAARKTYERVLQDQAADTVTNAIVREGEKAQAAIDRAEDNLKAAMDAERAALRAVNAQPPAVYEPVRRPATQTVEEWIAENPNASLGDTTVVYRNTADPEVVKQVSARRGMIGKLQSEYEKIRTQYGEALKDGTPAERKRLQQQLEDKILEIENAQNQIYEILNNAPLVKIDKENRASIAAMEEYEAKQTAVADAMLNDLRKKIGIEKAFKLKPRRMGPVVSKKGVVEQKPKDLTATQQAEVVQGKPVPLEKIAQLKASLQQIKNQLDYIKNNPSKTADGKVRQASAKEKALKAKERIEKQLAKAGVEQKAFIAEFKEAEKEAKAVRKEARKMTRAAKQKQQLQGIIDAEENPELLPQLAATRAAGTPLEEEIETESNAAVVMDQLAKSTTDPINKALAERFKFLLGNTKITLVEDLKADDGQAAFGTASSDGLNIYIDKATGQTEQTVLHEGVHSATERVLSAPEDTLTAEQLAAKRELQAMYDALMSDPDFTMPELMANLSEFAAESLTNPALRAYMKSKPWTLKHMWDSFKSALMRLLGIDIPENMSEAAIAAVDRLMTRVPRPTEADMRLSRPTLPRVASPDFSVASDVAKRVVASQRGWSDTIKENSTGLGFETKYVDRFAPLERIAKYMDSLKGMQMMYYLRMYDQRMNFVSQSAVNGVIQLNKKTREDGRTEYVIESEPGASLKNVADILKSAKDIVGDVDTASQLFTLYLAAKRAERVGFNKLNFGDAILEADIKAAMREISANEELEGVFKEAQNEYNEYNKGLVRFAEATGALSKDTADTLLATEDYVPYYRERNGVVELLLGGETPIRIGNIVDQPYLKELVGGNEPILNFMTSSVQNTNMLVDMALRNLATKNAVYELQEIGAAKITASQISGTDVVQFKDKGKTLYALINTEAVDKNIPSDLLVKGMEGIPTQLPTVLRLAAIPARFLRRAVTLSPAYAARQLFRDSVAAPLLTGADFTPVIGALKEIGAPTKATLEQRGIVGGQIFTGGQEDIEKVMLDIADGKGGWDRLVRTAESVTMEADALTRRAQYNSYIRQGLSEMEATLMSLESMNFNKRGASPSVHMANALIPFFNAQIQGLNVLYKSMTGKMPFNERLKIQQKLLKRGALIAAGTVVYAMLMEDDEAYKNATPDQKYGNWFIRIPGVDEPLRLPIPFEIGYIFKALPEAIYNSLTTKEGGTEAAKAFKQILLNTIPGGSSYGIPQVMKPAIEYGLGKSFYTGRDTLSAQEKELLPEAQFREQTTELSKFLGKTAGLSPIELDQLIRGYTGTMGLAFVQALSAPFKAAGSPEKAYRRLSDMPVIGGMFQPNDAGGIINAVFEQMNEYQEVENTVNNYITRGEIDRAKALVETKGKEFLMSEVAGSYTQTIRELTQMETAIRASNLSPADKRKRLDEIRMLKTRFATTIRDATANV